MQHSISENYEMSGTVPLRSSDTVLVHYRSFVQNRVLFFGLLIRNNGNFFLIWIP
jgi:hypothetical protein